MVKVLNTKVVPNIQFNLHAYFHNSLRHLSIFPRFIFTPVYLEICVEKEKGISPSWAEFPVSVEPVSRTGPRHPFLRVPLPVSPGVLVAPPVRDHCLCMGPPVPILFPQIPILCSSSVSTHRQICRYCIPSYRLAPPLLQLLPRQCAL
jgi:hypothetical protein